MLCVIDWVRATGVSMVDDRGAASLILSDNFRCRFFFRLLIC